MTALHYEITGPRDAPALVLSGSLGADLSMWEPQLALADRFRVIRVDTRGHGHSPAPPGPYTVADLGGDVLELIDTLALDQVAFVGVSLGAMIGLWIATVAPLRLTGLVSICSAAHVPTGDAFRERAAAVRAAGGTSEIADAVVDRWLTPEFAAAHPHTRRWLRAMIIGTDPQGYASCAEAVAAVELRPQLRSIVTPTLVISGAQDQALPVALQEEIAAGIPDARHVILDPGAHIASVERAGDVNELIEAHLR
jgi:3-oxoadipate enol-lactonase